MDIKSKNKGTSSIIITLFAIIICGFFISTLILNNNMLKLEDDRLKLLDSRELAKEWVVQEVINYLSVVDENTWNIYSKGNNLDDKARNQIYTNSFKDFNLTGATKYMIVDSQYTIDKDLDSFKVYVNTVVEFEESKRELVFIATLRGNKITNMVVY